jgi:tetratricopeptide (TPR) repeat protein
MVLKRCGMTLLLIGIMLLMNSCNALEPGLSVLKGNYLFQQGRYQDALLLYLKGKETEKFESRIHYNIGNVYYALGEGPAALDVWSGVEAAQDPEVSFDTVFNIGVIHYQLGNYPEAYNAFRTALELDSGNLDAKKNLELTIDRMEAEARSNEPKVEESVPETTDDARRILQYIKRKEGRIWKAESGEPASGNDW